MLVRPLPRQIPAARLRLDRSPRPVRFSASQCPLPGLVLPRPGLSVSPFPQIPVSASHLQGAVRSLSGSSQSGSGWRSHGRKLVAFPELRLRSGPWGKPDESNGNHTTSPGPAQWRLGSSRGRRSPGSLAEEAREFGPRSAQGAGAALRCLVLGRRPTPRTCPAREGAARPCWCPGCVSECARSFSRKKRELRTSRHLTASFLGDTHGSDRRRWCRAERWRGRSGWGVFCHPVRSTHTSPENELPRQKRVFHGGRAFHLLLVTNLERDTRTDGLQRSV